MRRQALVRAGGFRDDADAHGPSWRQARGGDALRRGFRRASRGREPAGAGRPQSGWRWTGRPVPWPSRRRP